MASFTAYCGGPCPYCQTTGTTANGTKTKAQPYNLAASSALQLGTSVFIPSGLGVLDGARAADRFFSVDDRGGLVEAEAKRYGVLRLDLRVISHKWAVNFGRRTIPVYIINKEQP